MVEKVRAAVGAKTHPDFIVCARTDARSVDGLDAAIERGCAYRDAGADMIFPEGLGDIEEFSAFAEGCPGLLLANMTEFGKTPMIHIDRFEALGYDLVIYPVTMQRIAMSAVTSALQRLQAEGTAEGLLDDMQTRQDLYELLGYMPGTPWSFPGSTSAD